MATATLHAKFLDGLGDIYDAEHRLLAGQQEMLAKASADDVKKLLEEHIEQTRGHITNLEQAFSSLGETARRVQCQGSAGLVAEAQREIKDAAGNQQLLDYVIAGAAGKGEHYEIVSYEGLIAEAEAMGHKPAIDLLKQNLKEEEAAAKKLEKAEGALLKAAIRPQEREMGASDRRH